MTTRPLLVLSLEGLATSALSCYGSSWNSTPAIDTIAGSGCVWNRCIATSDNPSDLLREAMSADKYPWPQRWCSDGTIDLITDVALPDRHMSQSCFDRIEGIPGGTPTADETPVRDIVDSQFGCLVAAAIQRDQQPEPWSVMWIHSGFLARRWDAPRDLVVFDEESEESIEPIEEAEQLEAEQKADTRALGSIPATFDRIDPPREFVAEDGHPDLITSWMRTYACQVRLLDVLIELLLSSLRVEDPIIVLFGVSGFRLGQGGWIGHRQGPLRSPDIHVPLIVGDSGPLRIPQLTSSSIVPRLLHDLRSQDAPLIPTQRWSVAEDSAWIRTESARSETAVTTPKWFFVRDCDQSKHLFLKPDDIEDFNDVGRIREDIVQQFCETKENPVGQMTNRVFR